MNDLPPPPSLPPVEQRRACWLGILFTALGLLAAGLGGLGYVLPQRWVPFFAGLGLAGGWLAHAYCPNAHGQGSPLGRTGSTSP